MELSYYTLLKSDPINIKGVCHILPPKLNAIQNVDLYQQFLIYMNLSPMDYYEIIGKAADYDAFSDSQKMELDIYHLITKHQTEKENQILYYCLSALSFFIEEEVHYDRKEDILYTIDPACPDERYGIITPVLYGEICDVISQLTCTKQQAPAFDLSKAKNNTAAKIMEKLWKSNQDSRQNNSSSSHDKNLEMANIISKLCARHPSINLLNVYELTIFQLFDQFNAVCKNVEFETLQTSVAYWGNKNVPGFSLSDWYNNTR